MKVRIIIMFALLAILLLQPSCIKLREIGISCDQFNKNPNATSELQATVNEIIKVKLCSNPTTGFQWNYEITGQNVLRETNHKFVPSDGEGVVGAAGKETWTFQAVEKGIAEVRMEYRKPQEGGGKAEWTYILTVTVE